MVSRRDLTNNGLEQKLDIIHILAVLLFTQFILIGNTVVEPYVGVPIPTWACAGSPLGYVIVTTTWFNPDIANIPANENLSH